MGEVFGACPSGPDQGHVGEIVSFSWSGKTVGFPWEACGSVSGGVSPLTRFSDSLTQISGINGATSLGDTTDGVTSRSRYQTCCIHCPYGDGEFTTRK